MTRFTVLCQPSPGYLNARAVFEGVHDAYGPGLFVAEVDADSGEQAATKANAAFQTLGCPDLHVPWLDLDGTPGDRYTVVGWTSQGDLRVVAAVRGEHQPVWQFHGMLSHPFAQVVDAESAGGAIRQVENRHYAAMAEED